MSGRGGGKGHVILQTEVKSNDEWTSLIEKGGLVVVDVYAAWCGPCKAIVSTLKKMKNEIGDDLLSFATAESDVIDDLENYRGKSEPTFLFYGSGSLVNVVRGCNCPLLIKTINNELKTEHEVINQVTTREPFTDKVLYPDDVKEKEDVEKPDPEEEALAEDMSRRALVVPKEVTVAVIKPDAVQAGLTEQILTEIESCGLEILQKEERLLSADEASNLYREHAQADYFQQLVEFMTSGPSVVLVLSKPGEVIGEDLVSEFHKLIGPRDVNTAKEEAPDSLRAKFGTDTIQNALHSCNDQASAARELAFFFPDFNRPMVSRRKEASKAHLQRTLALIRPNAYKEKGEAILETIRQAGFQVANMKEIQLTREQVEMFYEEHREKEFFEELVNNMTGGPSLALCLAREDAVKRWRELLGPKLLQQAEPVEDEVKKKDSKNSLREMFGEVGEMNPLHGSDTEEHAQREVELLFPTQQTVAVIKPHTDQQQKESIIERIKGAGFTISAKKEVNLTKELAQTFYQEHEGKEFFENLTDYMSSGPTQFLILSREDAICGMRALAGPIDAVTDKQNYPNSLRAEFGKDLMRNAIHVSSNAEKARDVITNFFPEISQQDQEGKAEKADSYHKEGKEGEENGEVPEQPNDDNKATNNVEETANGEPNTVFDPAAEFETKEPHSKHVLKEDFVKKEVADDDEKPNEETEQKITKDEDSTKDEDISAADEDTERSDEITGDASKTDATISNVSLASFAVPSDTNVTTSKAALEKTEEASEEGAEISEENVESNSGETAESVSTTDASKEDEVTPSETTEPVEATTDNASPTVDSEQTEDAPAEDKIRAEDVATEDSAPTEKDAETEDKTPVEAPPEEDAQTKEPTDANNAADDSVATETESETTTETESTATQKTEPVEATTDDASPTVGAEQTEDAPAEDKVRAEDAAPTEENAETEDKTPVEAPPEEDAQTKEPTDANKAADDSVATETESETTTETDSTATQETVEVDPTPAEAATESVEAAAAEETTEADATPSEEPAAAIEVADPTPAVETEVQATDIVPEETGPADESSAEITSEAAEPSLEEFVNEVAANEANDAPATEEPSETPAQTKPVVVEENYETSEVSSDSSHETTVKDQSKTSDASTAEASSRESTVVSEPAAVRDAPKDDATSRESTMDTTTTESTE